MTRFLSIFRTPIKKLKDYYEDHRRQYHTKTPYNYTTHTTMASNNSMAYLVECVKECETVAECMKKVRMINNKKESSIDGFIFEKLFDLCFKFDLVGGVTNKDFIHISGNVSLGRGKEITSLMTYISETKIDNSCGTGFSDITMKCKATGAMVFVQSKYFTSVKDVTKNMNDYDIANIVARKDFDEERGDELWLCVHNKKTFEEKVICSDCGATLGTYADACKADLDEPCPGYLAIERAKTEFGRQRGEIRRP